MPTETQPTLSILIPAYNYPAGVLRIVLPLLAENRSDIEILVHDDSTDDSLEACMPGLSRLHPVLSYVRNSPALGPIGNWNNLLKRARGRYAMLIHHDDFPLSETFASDLLAELEKNGWPDAVILSCLAYDATHKKIRACICNPIRRFVAKHMPFYLFRRNVIGPPSVLVVRQDLFEGYDAKLRWLVDVEAYFHFLKSRTRRLFFSRLIMVSSTGLPGAISTSIRDNVKEITEAELAYIETKHPGMKRRTLNAFPRAAYALSEKIVWAMIRTSSLLCGTIMRPPTYGEVLHREQFSLDHPQERTIDAA